MLNNNPNLRMIKTSALRNSCSYGSALLIVCHMYFIRKSRNVLSQQGTEPKCINFLSAERPLTQRFYLKVTGSKSRGLTLGAGVQTYLKQLHDFCFSFLDELEYLLWSSIAK